MILAWKKTETDVTIGYSLAESNSSGKFQIIQIKDFIFLRENSKWSIFIFDGSVGRKKES